MTKESSSQVTGLLLSGGLDSSILLAHLLAEGRSVQPFYVRGGLVWQTEEMRAVRTFLKALIQPELRPLVILDMPLADIYDGHWSVTGQGVPAGDTPDEAVFLPGRNALLLIKPMLWCQANGIGRLALAPLASNPFGDATDEFFADFQAALNRGAQQPVEIVRPFNTLHKRQVMLLGKNCPLEYTFSCISPVRGLHCGACNKCAERLAAFAAVGWQDPAPYATNHQTTPPQGRR